MSDLENQIVEEATEEILDEKKVEGSGEVPEPVAKKAKAPTTKAGMINAMMGKMSKMKAVDLKAMYHGMDKKESYKEDVDANEKVTSIKEIPQITSSDIDVQEDVAGLFKGQELSEGFVSKATTLFETAIVNKVNTILENVAIDM